MEMLLEYVEGGTDTYIKLTNNAITKVDYRFVVYNETDSTYDLQANIGGGYTKVGDINYDKSQYNSFKTYAEANYIDVPVTGPNINSFNIE